MNGSGKKYLDDHFKETKGQSHNWIVKYDWESNRMADVGWVIIEGHQLCGWAQ